MDVAEVVRVLDSLEAAGVRPGITGGWGIDALLRRQTRPHGDVDLGVAADLIKTAVEALRPLGYVVTADQRPARMELVSAGGKVDLHPIVWHAWGAGVQTGLAGEKYDYPPGSLEAEGEIGGRPVRCGTPALQLAFHLGYDPTEVDRRDMTLLKEALGLSLPWPYTDQRA